MKTKHLKWHITVLVVLIVSSIEAANLANPAITLPEARISIGASYHLGGYTLSDQEIPSLFNRIHGRVEYGPFKYLTLGIDAGAILIEVDSYVDHLGDSIENFHGKFGFSGGAHLKLSTPSFVKKIISFIMIAQATLFKSSDDKLAWYYGGKDGTGIIGIQFHIPGFGFISAGPWVYLIQGENNDGFYSNTDNVRGWLAIDYFPKLKDLSTNKPYLSLEFSISPKATYSERIPVQAFSVSISIGAITKRLYGIESDIEWTP